MNAPARLRDDAERLRDRYAHVLESHDQPRPAAALVVAGLEAARQRVCEHAEASQLTFDLAEAVR